MQVVKQWGMVGVKDNLYGILQTGVESQLFPVTVSSICRMLTNVAMILWLRPRTATMRYNDYFLTFFFFLQQFSPCLACYT